MSTLDRIRTRVLSGLEKVSPISPRTLSTTETSPEKAHLIRIDVVNKDLYAVIFRMLGLTRALLLPIESSDSDEVIDQRICDIYVAAVALGAEEAEPIIIS